ncbi:hypothetical protein BJX99DRAFT_250700 [Aspergillus californicus]
MLPWIHPHLFHSVNPIKGRQLQASTRIQKGEVLLIDPPYAIIPTPTPATPVEPTPTPLDILCSNPQCNRLIQRPTNGLWCPNRCATDVAWCNETCRSADKPRHAFECIWLAKYSTSLPAKWGEYTFGMLWLIVRILARRYTDGDSQHDINPKSASSSFKSGWQAIQSLCGTPETWSHAQTREWTVLVKKYLSGNPSSLPHGLPNDKILLLICQEEANSFGLYPRETGIYPLPASSSSETEGRGEQFGAAVYPRASIANHSCCPNITHKPDKQGCMVFTASRDILAGEECCITYFDMAEFVTVNERREHLQSLFRFKCGCPRCVEEDRSVPEEISQWDSFGGFEE